MIYLAFNIVFASAFTLIIKWVGNRKREDIVIVVGGSVRLAAHDRSREGPVVGAQQSSGR